MRQTEAPPTETGVSLFDLSGRVVAITGGAGLLGARHAEAIAMMGGFPVIVDTRGQEAEETARRVAERYRVQCSAIVADITREADVDQLLEQTLAQYGRLDGLINNAANNPTVREAGEREWSRLETFSRAVWDADVAVGLTGAFLCSRVLGAHMARHGKGVIVNIASDLALVGPDQRLYRRQGLAEDQQPVKPVTYSVVKAGLIGLTRYLATYWADRGVRVNALSPGGIYDGQPSEFVEQLATRIPLARMARADEYQGAVIFLCSDASSYMTGTNLIIDGGRTCW